MRTRFAPSPTGLLHIGGARTALFAWLYAKSNQGSCMLRIEDTDKERSKDQYTKEIINSFKWLGIEFDEETVYQSQNQDRHIEVALELLDKGLAYVCTCSKERLDELRNQQQEEGLNPKYDGKCRNLSLDRTPGSVIRFKIPDADSTVFNDLVKGEISVENEELDDFIILRSDGTPTYNLSVVADDIDMGISHVIRGDDHISNTPKQINIFKALGMEVPIYGHLPMIQGEDGKRMSKRHGATGVGEYHAMGILPEALLNYLVRLGWAKGDEEFFSKNDLIDIFSEGKFNTSPASFSLEKLHWYNKSYLDDIEDKELIKIIPSETFKDDEFSMRVLSLIRERCNNLNEFENEASYFFESPKHFEDKDIKKASSDITNELLEEFKVRISALKLWNAEEINKLINEVVSDKEVGFGKIGLPLRLSLTGTLNSPSIDKVCELLGLEEVLERISFAQSEIEAF
jgi:glutamyl-tRNA synthetase